MKKALIRVSTTTQHFAIHIDNKLIKWLFFRVFQVQVNVPLPEDHKLSAGRVTKVTAPPEFKPDHVVKGGRSVRVMPKQLRKIKEGQEAQVEL